jgi:hypothetical protein
VKKIFGDRLVPHPITPNQTNVGWYLVNFDTPKDQLDVPPIPGFAPDSVQGFAAHWWLFCEISKPGMRVVRCYLTFLPRNTSMDILE